MPKKVNIAVQVLPKSTNNDTYKIVDKAIEVIQKSGIKYRVCPFETVMEGDYDEIMGIIKQIQEACFEAGSEEVITNIKIQNRKKSDVTIEGKMNKYD
ncbi:MAG: MTH1187 family thiamine-binding protein [Bacteroidales bacterium]|nr:MTH1187 family thiamine-binding protein [Bacteroidales bacterium]